MKTIHEQIESAQRMKECKTHGYIDNCPICVLKMQVEELRQRMTGLEMKRIEPVTIQLAPSPEPKLYSGFTTDEWNLMLKGGPLLCGADIGQTWIDSFDVDMIDEFSSGGGNQNRRFKSVKLIEQPNWRPHLTDECPVPGRVMVEIKTEGGGGGTGKAAQFFWIRDMKDFSHTRAYRILGT